MAKSSIELEAFEFIDQIDAMDNADLSIDLFSQKIKNFGFTDYLITHMPPPSFNFEPHIILSGWSNEWFDRYMEKEFYSYDPMASHTRNSIKPFFWDQIPWRKEATKKSTQVMNEAKVFGLHNGFSVPIHSVHGSQSCITMGGESIDVCPRAPQAIYLMSLYLYHKVSELDTDNFTQEFTPSSLLTLREKECLKWVATGKTDWEVSVILNISEHTVSAHIRKAMVKLNATSRTQAVVKSLKRGDFNL